MLLAESLAKSGRDGLACYAQKIINKYANQTERHESGPIVVLALSLEERAQLIFVALGLVLTCSTALRLVAVSTTDWEQKDGVDYAKGLLVARPVCLAVSVRT